MHIFRKYLLFFFIISFCFSACKEDDLVYDINQLQSSSYNANKNKLKSISQYISIVYANLFQQALSSNELVEITRCDDFGPGTKLIGSLNKLKKKNCNSEVSIFHFINQ